MNKKKTTRKPASKKKKPARPARRARIAKPAPAAAPEPAVKAKTLGITAGPLDAGNRLDQFITRKSGSDVFSRNVVKKLILEGSVSLNGELCADADRSIKEGDQVEVRTERPVRPVMLGEKIPFGVIYEDNELLVVNKPAGLVVHPGAGNAKGTLVHALLGTNRKLSDVGGGDRPGIVHRLDKDTSGLLVVAKTNRAHRELVKAFSSREVHKEYEAIVQGRVELMQGRIDRPVGRDRLQRTKMTSLNPEHAREATTHYKVEERFRHSTLVTLHPVTGRTHQIRVHMAFLGHPVVGDPIYGTPDGTRLALHARKISFDHPITKQTMSFEAPLPEDFKKRIKQERERMTQS